MKVYINADIEGISTTSFWEEVDIDHHRATTSTHALQMSREVAAACEGAIAAGATEIVVRDAHNEGNNMDYTLLPACCRIIRSYNGHPYSFMYGIDSSFDAAMCIGYHAAGGRVGNPLSHTMNKIASWVKLNGEYLSEFQIASYVCAREGVPVVFVSGDKTVCEDYKDLNPRCISLAVKDGYGGLTIAMSPRGAEASIRQESEKALRQEYRGALCKLPGHYCLEICYKEFRQAIKYSYYPGFTLVDENTIRMETDDFMQMMTCFNFVLD